MCMSRAADLLEFALVFTPKIPLRFLKTASIYWNTNL